MTHCFNAGKIVREVCSTFGGSAGGHGAMAGARIPLDGRGPDVLGQQLAIPADALLDTGTMQYVFVDKGQGYFEPRMVKVGPRTEDVVAIEDGLKAGEQVVTSANFILDSESRLKGAFASMGEPSRVAVGAPPAGAQNIQVEVLEPKTAKPGNNNMRILVKDASGGELDGSPGREERDCGVELGTDVV